MVGEALHASPSPHVLRVANCVGFHNYKFFYLFLMYASLFAIYICLASLPTFLGLVDVRA